MPLETLSGTMIETTVDGRYQILARVASGGMGEVFRAHDPVLNREVALKMLHATLAGDEDFIDRFRREARAAAKLSHPNIVAVHDWGQAGDTYFMVMEFVRGPNLRTLLSRNGPLQPAQASEVVSQVLSALEHAHGQGIVHRDVKPENVLITTDGVAKVADFGLARALAESRVTHAPGTVTGTVQYLAPEQIQGEPADPRTDLYATGIVLYELLVGKVPFTGETSVAIAYKHLRDRVPAPSEANPMVAESLDRVVEEATEKDRGRRVPDAAEMRRRLAQGTADLPPAPPLEELVKSVPPVDEAPSDRAPTVTIPRTLSPKARRRRLARRALWVTTLLALVFAVGWAGWTYVIPHRTDVPSLSGLTLTEAQRRAERAGLDLVVSREEFSSDVEAGQVISQRPPPGAEVERGSQLTVVLSRGPELVTVPNVLGKPLPQAREAIRDRGLEVRVVRVFSDDVDPNHVVSQSQGPGGRAEVGTTVELRVSRGPEPVEVPDVVGRSAEDAAAILEAAGFAVERTQEFSDSVARGNVIAQAPEAGIGVDPGTTVTITVSKGPQRFPMPDVLGMSKEAARSRLANLGLVVDVVQLPGSSGNTVVGQKPEEGTTVEAGQEVTIYIGGN